MVAPETCPSEPAPPPAVPPASPGFLSLLLGPFFPARHAMRTQQVSLKRAWFLHLFCVAVCVALGVLLALGLNPYSWSWVQWRSRLWRVLQDIMDEFERNPRQAVGVVLAFTAAIEGPFIALALLVGPWGARVESIPASIRHTLRRTWLQTPVLIACTLLFGITGVTLVHAKQDWEKWLAATGPQVPPYAGRRHIATTQEGIDHERRMREVSQAWEALDRMREKTRPLYVRYDDELMAMVCCALGAWFLHTLLRGLAAPRETPQTPQPPLCECCGYNLSVTPIESNCPECGETVAASLGPHARPGTAWEHRREIGRLAAYWQTFTDVGLRPTAFGRQLRIYRPGRDHGAWLAFHCVVVGLLGVAMPMGMMTLHTSPNFNWRHELFSEAILIGFAWSGSAIGMVLLGAGLIGLISSIRARRGLLPAAVQCAAYLSAWLVVATLVVCLGVFLLEIWKGELFRIVLSVNLPRVVVPFVIVIAPCLLAIAWLALALSRIVAAARYANR